VAFEGLQSKINVLETVYQPYCITKEEVILKLLFYDILTKKDTSQ